MAVAMIGPKFYAWDRNGKPLAFGKLYTYQARTNNPKDTYQSEDQIVPNSNPVILNGEGYANVYLSGSYKMVLKDADENEIWSSDPVSSAEPSEWVVCLTATYVSSTTVKVNGNFTTQYSVGRRVRIDNNTSDYSYSTVKSVVFAANETTIELFDPVITTGVREICASIVTPDSQQDLGASTDYVFNNIDDLKAGVTIGGFVVDLKVGNSVNILGYYEALDGGEKSGVIVPASTGTDDGGSFHDLNNGLQFKTQFGDGVYVEQFGGVTVDTTDRTTRWEACRDYCLADVFNRQFRAKYGQHQLPSGVNLYALVFVDIKGNIVASDEFQEVIIGSNVVQANPSRYFFRNGNCTLKVEGMSRGHVEFLRFEGLHLFATNETGVTTTKYNVSYSNFYFTEVDRFIMETNTVSGTTAWMNENKFFGARIRQSLTMTGDYPMNNNAFYGFKMEGITITLDAYNGSLGAHSNTWHDTRFEFNMIFNFGVGTFNNTFINTWANFSFVGFVGRNAGSWTINDLGENNDIVTMQHTYTDAETVFDINSDSANYRWDHFEKQGNQLKNRKTFTPFMDTGLIPLDNPIWFVIETDANNIFNYFVEIFDDNGNRIYEDLNVVQAGLQWNDTFDYYDTSGVAAGGYEISIRKTTGVGFFRLWCRTAGGTLDELMTYWRCRSIQKKKGNRNIPLLPYFGRQDNFFGTSVPTYGTFTKGDIVENSAPAVGQPSYWKCVTSGTFSAASATGGTTTGNIGNNRAQISNLSDTSAFKVGDYISASAGFAAGDLKVISIDSATELTVGVTSTSAETGVTIQTVTPVFGAGPNLV